MNAVVDTTRVAPRIRHGVSPLVWAAGAIALLAAAPVFAVLASLLQESENASFLWSSTGPDYVAGTLLLCLIVGVGASLIGAGAAALIALTEFPGRRLLSFALITPFAIPAYITAYAYTDLLSPFGPVANLLSATTGDGNAGIALPDLRNLTGAAFVLTLGVYAYVYLAMRASLAARSGAYLEAARSLGVKPDVAVWRVFLPAGRAALAGGLALALMETAADYGVADYFGVRTLSTGIFRTWYGLGDLTAASQLAALLFLIALLLVLLEEGSRRGKGGEDARAQRGAQRLKLSSTHSVLAFSFCAAPVLLGFVIPVGVLILNFQDASGLGAMRGLQRAVINTGAVGLIGAAVTILLAIMLAYAARGRNSIVLKSAIRLATLGYALPGAVIAIGILSAVTAAPGISTVSAGVALLIYAYAARFLTAGYNSFAGGLAQINNRTDDAARALGANSGRILTKLHLPLSRGAITAGALIVFIDIAKELPATLLLQPFNYETMATRVYRLASDERLADASPAALILIGMGLIAVALLDRIGAQKR